MQRVTPTPAGACLVTRLQIHLEKVHRPVEVYLGTRRLLHLRQTYLPIRPLLIPELVFSETRPTRLTPELLIYSQIQTQVHQFVKPRSVIQQSSRWVTVRK